jgi:ribokinase
MPEHCKCNGFSDVALIVPNENEAQTLLNEAHGPDDPAALADRLKDFFDLRRVVITLGAAGVYVLNGGRSMHLPAMEVKAIHTGGGGDCFTGVLAFGLHHDADLLDAPRFGVLCSGRAVSLPGTFPS